MVTVLEEKQVSTKGQVAEEKVHGSMQAGVHADGQEDEQVSQDPGQVYAQEEDEKELLLLGLPGKPPEEELNWSASLICLDSDARREAKIRNLEAKGLDATVQAPAMIMLVKPVVDLLSQDPPLLSTPSTSNSQS